MAVEYGKTSLSKLLKIKKVAKMNMYLITDKMSKLLRKVFKIVLLVIDLKASIII